MVVFFCISAYTVSNKSIISHQFRQLEPVIQKLSDALVCISGIFMTIVANCSYTQQTTGHTDAKKIDADYHQRRSVVQEYVKEIKISEDFVIIEFLGTLDIVGGTTQHPPTTQLLIPRPDLLPYRNPLPNLLRS
jgi:hypothetical protein